MSDPNQPESRVSPGQIIGNYRVLQEIGQGGMGVVFEAVHEEIERRAAIKVLHADISHNPDIARRFLNEAKAVTRIQHPGLVQVFDFGRLPDGSAYIIMEFLLGESLGDRLTRGNGRLGEREAMRLGRQLALALCACHDKDIIHRDLKPENVMLVPDPEMPGGERAKILDFGIAKMRHPGTRLTRTNAILGTAIYMSPEQCRGSGHIDDRTDVYGLGVMLYEMLSGQPPFVADEDVEVMTMHLRTPAPALHRTSPELAALVAAMLAKAPTERPAMGEVAETLSRMLEGQATGAMPALAPQASGASGALTVMTAAGPAPRRNWLAPVLIAGACLLGLGSGGLWLLRRAPAREVPGGITVTSSQDPGAGAITNHDLKPMPSDGVKPSPDHSLPETRRLPAGPAMSAGAAPPPPILASPSSPDLAQVQHPKPSALPKSPGHRKKPSKHPDPYEPVYPGEKGP